MAKKPQFRSSKEQELWNELPELPAGDLGALVKATSSALLKKQEKNKKVSKKTKDQLKKDLLKLSDFQDKQVVAEIKQADIISEQVEVEAKMAELRNKAISESKEDLKSKIVDLDKHREKKRKAAKQDLNELDDRKTSWRERTSEKAATARSSYADAQKELDLLSKMIDDAWSTPRLVSETLFSRINSQFEKAKDAVRSSSGAMSGVRRELVSKLANFKPELGKLEELATKNSSAFQSKKQERSRAQRQALLEVREAEQELKKAKLSGNRKKIASASDDLKKAQDYLAESSKSSASKFLDEMRGEDGVISLHKGASKALNWLGTSAKEKAGKVADSIASAPGKAYGAAISSLLNKFEGNPKAVEVIKNLDKGTRMVASAVSSVGSETFRWLGKKLAGLTSMLWGFMKRPFSAVSNMGLGNLLGLAALTPLLFKPILDGINDELESRFGKTYVQDFISKLWSKAWSFLVEKVKEVLGIDDASKKKKEQNLQDAKTKASNSQLSVSKAQEALSKANTPEEKAKAQQLLDTAKYKQKEAERNVVVTDADSRSGFGAAKTDWWISKGKKWLGAGSIEEHLASYNQADPSGKKSWLLQLKQDIMNAPLGVIKPEIAQQLSKLGIEVPPEKIDKTSVYTPTETTSKTTQTTTSTPDSSQSAPVTSQASSSAPISVSTTNTNPVSPRWSSPTATSTPTTATPSSGPVVATPPPPANTTSENRQVGYKQGGPNGIGIGQIPFNAVNDGLHFMNLGMAGGNK